LACLPSRRRLLYNENNLSHGGTTNAGNERGRSPGSHLKQEGVEVIFGIPGVQIMDAVDAVYRSGGIRWISTRHEQTAAYMAFGYARTTAKSAWRWSCPAPAR
jgi:hypothetical protein